MKRNAEKTEEQKLFEELRHLFACQHQVPAHLTLWELVHMKSIITKEIIVCKEVL